MSLRRPTAKPGTRPTSPGSPTSSSSRPCCPNSTASTCARRSPGSPREGPRHHRHRPLQGSQVPPGGPQRARCFGFLRKTARYRRLARRGQAPAPRRGRLRGRASRFERGHRGPQPPRPRARPLPGRR
ncbi:MAG: hypothetical protein MZV64_49835 [Ignavibacteriales bacterium]|nr:hypothetical protein [Ignavibacteriales bacterium]